jgi:UDP-N-acetylglucosamine 3-dehydrogenase
VLKDTLNFAVIGAGYWGKKVTREYLQLAKLRSGIGLSMVCDLDQENLRYCNENLGVPKQNLFKDYNEALSSRNIDAVHICTPNDTHHPICKQALMAGKHALLEKPMAMTAKQAWELVGTADHKHLILQVGHIFRFNNALRAVRDLITQNYLGDLYYLKLEWTTLSPSPMNRDIIFDLGPHPIDILNFLLNKWPSRVTCKAEAYRRESLEELAYFTLEYDKKLMGHVELSWLQPGKKREVIIVGSERAVTVDCLSQSVNIYENTDGDAFPLPLTPNNTILDEVGHFAESISIHKNGRNSGSIGARNVAILEDLRRSLERKRTINVAM